MNEKPEIDKAEIAERAQRMVERAALHNIRKLAEQVKASDSRQRRRETRIVIAVVVLVAILLGIAGLMLAILPS